jgi:hypothetical protein
MNTGAINVPCTFLDSMDRTGACFGRTGEALDDSLL